MAGGRGGSSAGASNGSDLGSQFLAGLAQLLQDQNMTQGSRFNISLLHRLRGLGLRQMSQTTPYISSSGSSTRESLQDWKTLWRQRVRLDVLRLSSTT